jgi:hypothetical protein
VLGVVRGVPVEKGRPGIRRVSTTRRRIMRPTSGPLAF